MPWLIEVHGKTEVQAIQHTRTIQYTSAKQTSLADPKAGAILWPAADKKTLANQHYVIKLNVCRDWPLDWLNPWRTRNSVCSCANDFLLWCSSWFLIYSLKWFTADSLTESAKYPSCHSNLRRHNLVLLIQHELSPLIS